MSNTAAVKLGCTKSMGALALCAMVLVSSPAQAHVKWFSKVVNCISVPRSPIDVITTPNFLLLYMVAVLIILGSFLWEKRLLPQFEKANQSAGPLKSKIAASGSWLLRVGVALYFASLLTYGSSQYMLLTPELVVPAKWVPGIHMMIVLTVLWRRTALIAAGSIVALFGYATLMYGGFHMVDYLYFLGVAFFLALDSLYGLPRHYLGFAALRLSAGISFLWVSVEKWMYPTWAYDILDHELHQITMGIDTPFFVMAAGFVEFSLAFLLLFGRVSSQVCSLLLLLIMVAAIPLVGSLDAIGHAPLLIALLIFTLVQNRIGYPTREAHYWRDGGHILSYAISLPGFIGLYYLCHLLAYPDRSNFTSQSALLSVVLSSLLVWRVVTTMPHLFKARNRLARSELDLLFSQTLLQVHE